MEYTLDSVHTEATWEATTIQQIFLFIIIIYIKNEYKKKHALYLVASISVGYVWQETVAERPPRSAVRKKQKIIAPQEKTEQQLNNIAPISDKIVKSPTLWRGDTEVKMRRW